MANARIVVITLSVVFLLFWCGILQFSVRGILSLLLSPFPAIRIQYVADSQKHQASDESDSGLEEQLADAFNDKESQMSKQMMDVVQLMEDLVASSEMDRMSDQEMEDTFRHLYDLFPLMDSLFETAIKQQSGISINPRVDYHETHRRFEVLRRILEQKRSEKNGQIMGEKNMSEEEYNDMAAGIEDEL